MLTKSRKIFGISLLEIMLVLTIIAAILLVVTRYYNLTREHLRVAEATTMVKNVAAASYKWVEGEADFSGLGENGIPVLIAAGLLPASYASDSVNPWHSTVTAKAILGTGEIGVSVDIRLTNVPETSCNDLVEKLKAVTPSTPVCISDNDNKTFSIIFEKP